MKLRWRKTDDSRSVLNSVLRFYCVARSERKGGEITNVCIEIDISKQYKSHKNHRAHLTIQLIFRFNDTTQYVADVDWCVLVLNFTQKFRVHQSDAHYTWISPAVSFYLLIIPLSLPSIFFSSPFRLTSVFPLLMRSNSSSNAFNATKLHKYICATNECASNCSDHTLYPLLTIICLLQSLKTLSTFIR